MIKYSITYKPAEANDYDPFAQRGCWVIQMALGGEVNDILLSTATTDEEELKKEMFVLIKQFLNDTKKET